MARIAAIFLALCAASSVAATSDEHPSAPEIGVVEKLGDFVPADLVFFDADGDSVVLGEAIDKPTILTLVYYHCPSICKPLLGSVAEVIAKTDLEPGTDYDVLTISFDETDTPAKAASIRDNVVNSLGKPVAPGGWEFLTADSATIARLTEAVGFGFERREKDFAHSTALIVLSADRKIVRYIYGKNFLPFDLKMAVAEAGSGRVVPSIARVLQYCFAEDPSGRRFVLNFNRVIGTGVVLFAVGWVFYVRATGKRRGKSEA